METIKVWGYRLRAIIRLITCNDYIVITKNQAYGQGNVTFSRCMDDKDVIIYLTAYQNVIEGMNQSLDEANEILGL